LALEFPPLLSSHLCPPGTPLEQLLWVRVASFSPPPQGDPQRTGPFLKSLQMIFRGSLFRIFIEASHRDSSFPLPFLVGYRGRCVAKVSVPPSEGNPPFLALVFIDKALPLDECSYFREKPGKRNLFLHMFPLFPPSILLIDVVPKEVTFPQSHERNHKM